MTLPISVVIPTYNRKESLRLTLDGLARQTLSPDCWEAVVVSDGSTDGTDAFLGDYAASAPFTLRPMSQANAGPSEARNQGIRAAAGDVVVFIDDDVAPMPEFLATHWKRHESDSKIAVIGPLSPDPARRSIEPAWIGWEHAMLEKQYSAFRDGIWSEAGPHHFYSGNASVRRAHLLAVGGFDTAFTRQEDVELATRLQRDRGVHFVFDGEARTFHRPLRTWDAWLKVPYAYGSLDVLRARRGDLPWEKIREAYAKRNRITRTIARFVLARPALSPWVRKLLRGAANALYRVRQERTAYETLSALYNVRYLEGSMSEMDAAEKSGCCFGNNFMPAVNPRLSVESAS